MTILTVFIPVHYSCLNIFSLFSQNIWSIKKKAVPLQPISELTRSNGPDGGIGRRAGLKHQWSNPCRFDPGSGYKDRLTKS